MTKFSALAIVQPPSSYAMKTPEPIPPGVYGWNADLYVVEGVALKITTGGEVVRLWSGNSQTSIRHFNSFLIFYDLPPVRFASLPVMQ